MSTTTRRRPSSEQREQDTETALSMYGSGSSIRAIADRIGRSFGYVRSLLLQNGVELRARGGYSRGHDV